MNESRHLQASHRSSSHRPSEDSIHYKAYSISLLSKQATVEVYCIHTRQLLYAKQFDKRITNVVVIAAAYDYWVVHANLIDDDQQSKSVECLISVDEICCNKSSTINVELIKYPSQSFRYTLKYAASRRVVYRTMGGNLPSSFQLACLQINIDNNIKISHIMKLNKDIKLSDIVNTGNNSSDRKINTNSFDTIKERCAHSDCIMLSLKRYLDSSQLLVCLRLDDKGDIVSTSFEYFVHVKHNRVSFSAIKSSKRLYAIVFTVGPVCSMQIIEYRNDRLLSVYASSPKSWISFDLKLARKQGYSIKQITQTTVSGLGFVIW